jgi:hypothetical protein
MERLTSDPAAAARMGERWPADLADRFDYRHMVRDLLAVYGEVLGS